MLNISGLLRTSLRRFNYSKFLMANELPIKLPPEAHGSTTGESLKATKIPRYSVERTIFFLTH